MKLNKRSRIVEKVNEGYSVFRYLSIEEIYMIVEEARKVDNLIIRQALIDTFVIKLCTDIENLEEFDYDELVEAGVVEVIRTQVENYYDIQDYIFRYESMQNTLDRFLTELLERMPKDLNRFVSSTIKKFEKLGKKNDK